MPGVRSVVIQEWQGSVGSVDRSMGSVDRSVGSVELRDGGQEREREVVEMYSSWGEVEVMKYKKVKNRTKPVATTLPEEFRIV